MQRDHIVNPKRTRFIGHGTDLVRPRERSVGKRGIGETRSAEDVRWIGYLKLIGMQRDVFLGFRFPASPPLFALGFEG